MDFRRQLTAELPVLRRFARALTGDPALADDLVQDTLVRALRSEHLFHGGEIRSWLYTILTNLNRNRLRSLARKPVLSPIKDEDAADAAGPEVGGRDRDSGGGATKQVRQGHRAFSVRSRALRNVGRNTWKMGRRHEVREGGGRILRNPRPRAVDQVGALPRRIRRVTRYTGTLIAITMTERMVFS